MAKSTPRHFEFKDDKSSKFWEVWVDDADLTTKWGRIGTDGQSKTKPFADAASATKEMDKLIASKTKEGYVEIGATAPSSPAPAKPAAAPAAAKPEPAPVKPAPAAAEPAPGKTSARRFEYEDATSAKFWEVWVDGADLTTKWGRIGTDGQSKTKTFTDPAAAAKEMEKLIASKTKEGYEEPGQASGKSEVYPGDHAKKFGGKRVVEWKPEGGEDDEEGSRRKKKIDFAKFAISIGLGYEQLDEGAVWTDVFSQFLEQDGIDQVTSFIVGPWTFEGDDNASIIEALVAARTKLPNLDALLIGDIVGEEQEISWINQSDIGPIFHAFPKLKELLVRGGTGLSLGAVNHANLASITIQTGGLDVSVVRQVLSANTPELTHLELWLGDDNYGANTTAADLAPLFAKDCKLFPKLKYLGLKNTQITDAIAAALANSPILSRIEELDLSMGTLTDAGADALLASPYLTNLKSVDLHFHYLSKDGLARVKAALGHLKLDVSEQQKPDEDDGESYRYIQISE
jgi:predicted DNA-binding WGR domain protein